MFNIFKRKKSKIIPTEFKSLHEVEFTPQFMNEIKQKYGDKYTISSIINKLNELRFITNLKKYT